MNSEYTDLSTWTVSGRCCLGSSKFHAKMKANLYLFKLKLLFTDCRSQTFICLTDWKMVLTRFPSIILLIGAINWALLRRGDAGALCSRRWWYFNWLARCGGGAGMFAHAGPAVRSVTPAPIDGVSWWPITADQSVARDQWLAEMSPAP